MSLFDLSGVVQSFANVAVTVRRYAAETYGTDGKAVARTYVDTPGVFVNVQPVRGADLQRMPEGTRDGDELIALFTTTELRTKDQIAIPTRGNFEVEGVPVWQSNGNFWKAIARKRASSEPRS